MSNNNSVWLLGIPDTICWTWNFVDHMDHHNLRGWRSPHGRILLKVPSLVETETSLLLLKLTLFVGSNYGFSSNSVLLGVLNDFSCAWPCSSKHFLNLSTVWGLRWCNLKVGIQSLLRQNQFFCLRSHFLRLSCRLHSKTNGEAQPTPRVAPDQFWEGQGDRDMIHRYDPGWQYCIFHPFI